MLATVKKLDPSHGDWLTADNIAGRITSWLKSDTIVTGGDVVVLLDNKPLADASVTLEPEPWLGPAYHASTGKTNAAGYAAMSRGAGGVPRHLSRAVPGEDLQEIGGRETIPERYNEKTVLGREVAEDVPDRDWLFQFRAPQQVTRHGVAHQFTPHGAAGVWRRSSHAASVMPRSVAIPAGAASYTDRALRSGWPGTLSFRRGSDAGVSVVPATFGESWRGRLLQMPTI